MNWNGIELERYKEPKNGTWAYGIARIDGTVLVDAIPNIYQMDLPDEDGIICYSQMMEDGILCGYRYAPCLHRHLHRRPGQHSENGRGGAGRSSHSAAAAHT